MTATKCTCNGEWIRLRKGPTILGHTLKCTLAKHYAGPHAREERKKP